MVHEQAKAWAKLFGPTKKKKEKNVGYCKGYQLSDDGRCMSMKHRRNDGSFGPCEGEDCELFCAYLWQLEG